MYRIGFWTTGCMSPRLRKWSGFPIHNFICKIVVCNEPNSMRWRRLVWVDYCKKGSWAGRMEPQRPTIACPSIFHTEGASSSCIRDVTSLLSIPESTRSSPGDPKSVIPWLSALFLRSLIEHGVDELPPCNLFMWVTSDSSAAGVACNSGVCKEARESSNVVLEFSRVESSNFMVVVMIHARKAHPLGTSASATRIRE